MGRDENGIPTVGGPGETVDVVDSEGGSVLFDGPEDADELLEIAGVKTKEEMKRPLGELGGEVEESELDPEGKHPWGDESYEERVREALPEKAELTEGGKLRAENNRSNSARQGSHDIFNGKRRYILKRLDEGDEPVEILEDTEFSDSYIYRVRGVFGFILEDNLLKNAFLYDGGEFAPAHEPEEIEATSTDGEEEMEIEEEPEEDTSEELTGSEAEVNTKDLADIIDHYYEKGREEGREEVLEELEDEDDGSEADLFDSDEWWDLMKTLMEHGEDEYARRIASAIDFD